jgi:tetratricopeptide (TPR) repeat protein
VRRLLTELVRREVLGVRADPLSPQRGHYGFVQTMFRQVAYDTSSRRERKARHLAVADHLQSTFADGGEEVAEVIAAHLLEALSAVPDDPDVADIRDRVVVMLTRAGERAERTGAQASAASCYADAADLLRHGGTESQELAAAGILERAGRAISRQRDWSTARMHYDTAAGIYRRYGRVRDAGRVDAKAGGVARSQGRSEEARTMLEGALAVLAPEPDADTVAALEALALLHVFAGNDSEGERLCASALSLGQALDLPDGTLAGLFVTRGLAHAVAGRRAQASANLYEALRRADKVDNSEITGGALLNLTDALMVSDPAAATATGRDAVSHCRRLGDRYRLAGAAGNLIQALMLTGDWHEAGQVLRNGLAEDQLSGDSVFDSPAMLLSVCMGDEAQVSALLETVLRTPESEEPQDAAAVALSLGAASAYRGRHAEALQHAQKAVRLGAAYGPDHDTVRWAWPIAAEAALALGDEEEVTRLLDWLDSHQPGHVPRLLRAERLRIWARKLTADDDPEAASAFDKALTALRAFGSPYHVAVGLIDYAEYLHQRGETQRAHELVQEAETISARLGARPLSERARRISATAAEQVQEQPAELGAKA